jgi:hypothetical protein
MERKGRRFRGEGEINLVSSLKSVVRSLNIQVTLNLI